MFLPGTAKGAPEQTGSLRKRRKHIIIPRTDLTFSGYLRLGRLSFGPAFSICPAMDSASFRHGVKKNVKRKDFVNGGRKGQNRKMSARDRHRSAAERRFSGVYGTGRSQCLCTYGISVRIKRTEEQAGKTDTNRARRAPACPFQPTGSVLYWTGERQFPKSCEARIFGREQEQSEEDRWKERERAESRGMADCVG